MEKNVTEKKDLQLAVIYQNCGAIDVGSMIMMESYTDQEGNQCLFESDGFIPNRYHDD